MWELHSGLENSVLHHGVIRALLDLNFSTDLADFILNFVKTAEHVYQIHVVYRAASQVP
jgi:hypothetical protein